MTLKPWKRIKSQIKFKNPWWEYRLDDCLCPSGKKGEYHSVHTNGAAMIIPFFDNNEILMVNQFRYLHNKESLEFPCGSIKDGETIEETARKELIEETGFNGKLEKIGQFNPYNGIADDTTYVFIARELKPSNSATKDDCEEFELVRLSVKALEQKINTNEIDDGMSIATWALAKKRLK